MTQNRMTADDLCALATTARPGACKACAPLLHPGWDSLPGIFDHNTLRQVGTLADPAIDDPTVQEHHPGGTHAWSPDASIALAYFPYNRCGVWQCAACLRPFLRYTEYGGYYLDERIRPLDVGLIDETPLTGAV